MPGYWTVFIMMASSEHFERALAQRLVARSSCKLNLCTAEAATPDKLRRCALNGVSAVDLHVGYCYGCEELSFDPSLPVLFCILCFELLPLAGIC